MPAFATSAHSFGSGGRSLGPASRPAPWGRANLALPLDRVEASTNSRPPSANNRPCTEDWRSADPGKDWRKSEAKAPAPTREPAPAPAQSRAPAPPAPGPTSNFRDAFRVARSAHTYKSDEDNPPKLRAAVEAARWRSKLDDDGTRAYKYRDDKLDSYRQPEQAGWARERLLGHDRDRLEDERYRREEEEVLVRRKRAVAQAWLPDAEWVDVVAIDRVEDTLRKRLGELESQAAHAGRAARQFFAECDPRREGRVLLPLFVDVVGRKLNFDYPGRGGAGSSRAVLAALFARYDLEKAGVVGVDDLHAALVGASRDGRASGRVVATIGRLREGLVRCAGGYDALRAADHRWFCASNALGLPTGCLTAGAFVDELLELAQLCEVRLSEADLVTLLDAFAPPERAFRDAADGARKKAADADDPLVSFDELTLTIRGPPMNSTRVGVTRAAYAALKDDVKTGFKLMVKPAHLADRFDASKHPAVLDGALDEEAVAMAVLRVWCETREQLEEEVTIKAFCDRYEWISAIFDGDDDDFVHMMKAAWRLR